MKIYIEINETNNHKLIVTDRMGTYAFNDLNEVADWLKTYIATSV